MVKKTQRIKDKNPTFLPFHILTDSSHIYNKNPTNRQNQTKVIIQHFLIWIYASQMQIFLKQPCQPHYITHPSCPSTTYFGLAQTGLTEAFPNYKIGTEGRTVLIDFLDKIDTTFSVCLFVHLSFVLQV